MTYLSVCSGIEAASIAWAPLGFQPVAFSEIDRFPSAVLAHHHPAVPNYGDMTRFKDWPDADVDLLVGGTPCQSFSVAGLRAGLDDPRGSLMLTYLAIAGRYRPRWLVWENVPGVLSADDGRAFGSLLGGLAELGYGFAYRVLDAQYFELAQRRARVFVVGHLGDWRHAAAVLFERESLSGHPAPSREAGQRVANSLVDRPDRGGGNSEGQRLIAHSLRADGFDASEDGTGRGTPIVPIDMRQASRGEKLTNNRARGSGGAPGHGVGEAGDPAFTVTDRVQAIAFSAKDHGADAGDIAPTLRAGGFTNSHANGGCMPAVALSHSLDSYSAGRATEDGTGRGCPLTPSGMQVRRLTPRECERLQGFPDDYTLIPYNRKPAKDGPRYKALGNSMAVPVMRWIGRRMQMVEDLVSPPDGPVREGGGRRQKENDDDVVTRRDIGTPLAGLPAASEERR